MLLSIHVPKTAGTSFFKTLSDVYGSRVRWHNPDWLELETQEAIARRERHRLELIGDPMLFASRFDAVHGHFAARKYRGLFRDPRLVTFVRDPFQHAVSTYEFGVRSESLPFPGHRTFRERNMSIVELIETYPDHQSLYLDGVPLDEFALVGITEHYAESLALFERIFNVTIPNHAPRENVNPDRPGSYAISADVRRAVHRHRGRDVELYRQAVERFDRIRKTATR